MILITLVKAQSKFRVSKNKVDNFAIKSNGSGMKTDEESR